MLKKKKNVEYDVSADLFKKKEMYCCNTGRQMIGQAKRISV